MTLAELHRRLRLGLAAKGNAAVVPVLMVFSPFLSLATLLVLVAHYLLNLALCW